MREIEELLRDRLKGTLPGIEAQMRFAPMPQRMEWRVGHFPHRGADRRRTPAALPRGSRSPRWH